MALLWLPLANYAQKTSIYRNPEAEYRTAIELLNKEKYGAAMKSFLDVYNSVKNDQAVMKSNSEYYAALCALELFNGDAEYLMSEFIKKHPENINLLNGYFQLGRFEYRKKKYNEAIASLSQVEIYDLTDEQKVEYNFKIGYSYFMKKDFANAKKYLFEIIETDNNYSAPANYFYGHIAYNEKNYETALKSFNKLVKDDNFGPIVPYYITQIYFLQKRYDDLLKVAPPLLDSGSTKRAPEIAKLIGESYFRTSRYVEAAPYLEMYKTKTNDALNDADYYQLGFAYYKSKNYAKAILNFKNVDAKQDTLSQLTQYVLADCYLKQGKKQFAMNSFNAVSKMAFDKEVQEDALFNFAKLTYELALNPYNEAITSLQQYITTYPNSPKVEEANTYLINLYMTTKNYKDALESIEKLKKLDPQMMTAYQKIAYFRAVQLFNDKKLTEALAAFDKSFKYPEDKTLNAQAYYWKGETYYRLNNFEKAKENYKTFLETPGAYSLSLYNMTQYNLGYIYFKQKDYDKANIAFRKFYAAKTDEKQEIVTDACLRIADCYFIKKDVASAIEYYDKVIAQKGVDVDYALYQKAMAHRVTGKFNSTVDALTNLTDKYPKSEYYDDAIFELGNTYFLFLNNNTKAMEYYNRVMTEFPKSNYAVQAMLNIGKIQYNSDNDVEALATFKNVITNYPGTPESQKALMSVKRIYGDMDKVEEFYAWVKSLPFKTDIKDSDVDSTTYQAAEDRYMDGDCEKAINSFKNYIQKFPTGFFIINANFYKAECDYKANNLADALKEYDFVVNSSVSKFMETSLLNAASISYKQGNYPKAVEYYKKLDNAAEYKNNILLARIGQMRCNYLMTKYTDCISSSRLLLTTEKISEDVIQEAHISIAKSALAIDSISLAQTEFEITAKLAKTELSAEAKYNLAAILYKLENYKESEKMVFEIINQVPSYDYWIAKSFILLADIYLKTDNIPQAKATLQSIIDNYDGAELLQVAHEKLNAINQQEKIIEQKKAQEDIEIKFGGNDNDKKENIE